MDSHTYYNDNASYRQFLRTFFNMDVSNIEKDEDDDDESFDEILFDNDACKRSMETIFHNTKTVSEFIQVYEKAAARMFSTDPEIGLAILCSYDHLWLFKLVYDDFLENSNTIKNMDNYRKLLNKI